MQDSDLDLWQYFSCETGDSRMSSIVQKRLHLHHADSARDAQSELTSRRDYWIARFERKTKGDRQRRWSRVGVQTVGYYVKRLVVFSMLAGIFGGMIWGPLGLVLLLMCIAAAPILYFRSIHNKRCRALYYALTQFVCPSCGYDLSGTRNAEIAGIELTNAGPPHCPECGVSWPLVPPFPSGRS